jgi:hypothetical protein
VKHLVPLSIFAALTTKSPENLVKVILTSAPYLVLEISEV